MDNTYVYINNVRIKWGSASHLIRPAATFTGASAIFRLAGISINEILDFLEIQEVLGISDLHMGDICILFQSFRNWT